MRVLIIGGTRFLGAAIARELAANNYEVTLLHRGQTQGATPRQARHLLGDARDRAAVERYLKEGKFDAVVDTILQADDLDWYLPLLRQYSGQIIHCGSTGVYAPMTTVPAREDDPCPCPVELGGFGAKLAQDEVLMRFHEDTGFKTCSLRVSNVCGAGDVPLDSWGARNPKYFQRVAQSGEIWIPNRGDTLVQPAHTSDLARGFRLAIESPAAAGQIYNLSSDRAITLLRYAETTVRLVGSASSFRFVPMEEIAALGKTDEAGLLFVCEHMSIDWSKAERELGYSPRVSIEESLSDSLRWMVKQGLLDAEVAA